MPLPGGLFATTNDSGDSGRVFVLDGRGATVGVTHWEDDPTDTEALAPAPASQGSRIWVGDIGDNAAVRSHIEVAEVPVGRGDRTVTPIVYRLVYPDGAHDAETLLVNNTGRLFIVTKDAKGGIYEAPKSPSRAGINKLSKVGSAPALVTDGTFLPDGKQIALLTYASVTVIDAKTYATVATAKIPKQPQAESLTVSLDGRSLLVGSEGKKSKVYSMAVPGAQSASSSPSATSDNDDTDTDPDDDTTSPQNLRNTGTLLAVGLAGFVAVVAGVVVAVVRKP